MRKEAIAVQQHLGEGDHGDALAKFRQQRD